MVAAAALAVLLGAAPAGAAQDPVEAWAEAVVWPLARYAEDLAAGEGRAEAGLLEADAATGVLLRVSVESDLSDGSYRVHNLDGRTASVPYAAARAAEAAHRAAIGAALARHRAESPAALSATALDWLVAQSAAMAEATAQGRDGPRPDAVLAPWQFFGFRRGGVVDLPGLETRSRAQSLKMLRALSAGAPASGPDPRRRDALRAVWRRAQRTAHATQYLLTGEQVRSAALELHPRLEAWAREAPVEDGERPFDELLAMTRDELKPLDRGRGDELWAALDANAARVLADAAALLARKGYPPAARPARAPAGDRPLFEEATSTGNFLVGSRDALDVVTAGGAVLDYDRDGRPDLVVGYAVARGGTLFHNEGGMRFTRVPGALGEGGQRAAPVDFDGDGWTDLLVLGDHESRSRLLHNEKGTFRDVSDETGFVPPLGIVETGVWFDADGDGDLDLYLVYLGRTVDRSAPSADGTNGSPNLLYLNEAGRLREATAGSGLEDSHWGWAAQALDFDGDGREDLFLCNLWGPSRLFRSLGGGRFEDATARAGVAQKTLCRGVAAGDADGDGRPDLFLSAGTMPQDLYRPFWGEESALVDQSSFTQGYGGADGAWQDDSLYLNRGDGTFVRSSTAALPGRAGMTWSSLLDDLDLDGREDLYSVNGFYPDTLFFHDERKVLRLGKGDGAFGPSTPGNGSDVLGTSRASLTADFDRDGCPDLFVTGLHGPRLFRGLCPRGRPALRLRLSQPAPNVDAFGARVELVSGGWRRTLRWGPYGGGQLSSFWGERLVGLGAVRSAEALVTWPDGTRESFGPLPAEEPATLVKGRGRAVDGARR